MSSQSPGIGSALPDMNANTSAYVLTNDGVTASWEAVTSLGLPPMGGNSGKYLTNNGSAASWAAVTADGILPSQTGKSGQFLSTNGTTVGWSAGLGGVTTMAAVGSSPSAEGASIATDTLTLQPADGTHPGVVTTAAQVFGGVKTLAAGALFRGGAPTDAGAIAAFAGTFFSGFGAGIGWTQTNVSSYVMMTDATTTYWNCETGGTHTFRVNNGTVATLSATVLDLTGLGNSGSIKLKDDAGATKTCTISGGVWVIS